MIETHEANYRPNVRKPKKDWTRSPEEEAAYQRMQAKCQARAHPPVNGSSGGDSDPQVAGANANPAMLADGSGTSRPAPSAAQPSGCNSTPAAILTWKRISRHVMMSGSQQFQVVKECVGNVSRNGVNYSNGRTVYQCWRRVEFLWYIKFEPYQETFEAAKAICEAYAKAHPFGQKCSTEDAA